MTDEQWEVVDEVPGDLQAEILRGLLEAQGFKVWLSQEGIGHFIYPVTISPMGRVQILVPHEQSQSARSLLDEYYAGILENMELEATSEDEDDDSPA
jgi:hypothetical protein